MKNIVDKLLGKILFPIIMFIIFGNYSMISQSFRIFPSSLTQTEPIITVSPLNPQVMFASGVSINLSGAFKSEGVYVTTTSGLSWFGSDTCKGANINNHGGDPGIAIDKNGIFILSHVGSAGQGLYTHYSTDMGNTWSNAYQITNQMTEDKGTMTTDNLSSSPFYGRTYVSWVNFVSPFPVSFSFSTNNGQTWSAPAPINNPPLQRCSGGYIKTGLNGKVFDVWAGVSNISPFTEQFAGFASSTDGGITWIVSQNVFTMNGINGTLTCKHNIRVNGLPRMGIDLTSGSRNGWIYVLTNEKNNPPAGSDPDIVFHRSTNGGASWSQGIRVNQDPLNNGKIQYFPAVDVDSGGGINVLYYDDRNTICDSSDLFVSRSTDGGDTWHDYPISDQRFQPKPIVGGPSATYQGDFIYMISVGNTLYPVWMADYTGTYQIWMKKININAIGVQQISSSVPENYFLKQNYPNPFNPSTTIEFSIPKRENVKIIIYDALGNEVSTLTNSQLEPGSYNVSFDGTNFASGIYFYQLQTNGFSTSKKMIIAK